MACPHVAGTLALGWSANASAPKEDLLACLYGTATDILALNPDHLVGAGMVDAAAFLACVMGQAFPTDQPTHAPTHAPTDAPTHAPYELGVLGANDCPAGTAPVECVEECREAAVPYLELEPPASENDGGYPKGCYRRFGSAY